MLQILSLRGRNALSEFRSRKLKHVLHEAQLKLTGVSAEFWHFVQVARALDNEQQAVLARVLTYGPAAHAVPETGQLLLVVPRLGTISPWSSKATDIARQCGLTGVERIERGTAYYATRADGGRLSASELAVLLPLIHDRMTETVLGALAEAEQLFHHYEPQPLATVDIQAGGIAALQTANREMGLALSADEIEYLWQNFARLKRNPTDVELMMFAQANSEHCRHKIFNADWVIDGEPQAKSLFAMIRNTHERIRREPSSPTPTIRRSSKARACAGFTPATAAAIATWKTPRTS